MSKPKYRKNKILKTTKGEFKVISSSNDQDGRLWYNLQPLDSIRMREDQLELFMPTTQPQSQ